jgi:DNA repair exonuclease SbcCD ATPase subunit
MSALEPLFWNHQEQPTMFNFIRHFAGVKADQAVQSGIEALVRWDPKGATEAELRAMEEHLDELGLEVAQARAAYGREKQEADAIQTLLNQRVAAAEMLQGQLTTEVDPTRRATLEQSLHTLLDMLEQMAPDVEREASEARDAQEFLAMLEQTYADAGAKLKEARRQLERAERDMRRAEQQREQAERQAEVARRAAGLSGTTNSLNVALKAMNEAAARDLAQAEAASLKAKLLAPTRPEQDDPNIAAALAAASGKGPVPQSASERLARLKARQG